MMIYKVFYRNYEFKRCELMGTLPERRENLRGKTEVQSGLRWARLRFGPIVKDENSIFVVPNKLDLGIDTQVT